MNKFLCILFAIVFLMCGCSSRSYEYGYEDGYEDGYDSGYEEGRAEGFSDGYSEAEIDLEDRFDDEWQDGYWDGYYDAENEFDDYFDEGYSDGYYSGATYTCLYFRDVDRAFQCAKNGTTWRAFIKGYDEYISDIYDTDGEESDLFWAFISVIISGDATAEEIALLSDTFGSDLFIRNGIDLNP